MASRSIKNMISITQLDLLLHTQTNLDREQSASFWTEWTSKEGNRGKFKCSEKYPWLRSWSTLSNLVRHHFQQYIRTNCHLLLSLDWTEDLHSLIQHSLIHLHWIMVNEWKRINQNLPFEIFFQMILGFGFPFALHRMTWFDPSLILTSWGSSIHDTGAGNNIVV